jgi:replicative DNA helicase
MKNTIVALLSECPPIDFALFDNNNHMVKWVKEYHTKYGILPSLELFQQEFFNDEPMLIASAPWTYYKEKLERDKLVRDLQPALSEFGARYSENPYVAVKSLIETAVQKARDCKPTVAPQSLKDGEARWKKFTSPDTKRILTGIPPLDEACGGISCDDEFMIISARLGIGKSWLGHFIALNMALHGHKVGIYSGEMSEHEVGARLDSLLSHVSNFELTRGKYTDFSSLKKAWSEVKGDVFILTTKHLNRNARPSDIHSFVVEKNLEVVLIDQLSLMDIDGKPSKEQFQTLSSLSLQLKTLQQELRVPIIAISQLNRAAEGEEASAANLSGSDRFGQDATLVLGLSRSKTEEKTLKIKVMKARSFKLPDKAWEFSWDIDRGYLTFQKSKLDAVKAAVKGAKVKDLEQSENVEEEDALF